MMDCEMHNYKRRLKMFSYFPQFGSLQINVRFLLCVGKWFFRSIGRFVRYLHFGHFNFRSKPVSLGDGLRFILPLFRNVVESIFLFGFLDLNVDGFGWLRFFSVFLVTFLEVDGLGSSSSDSMSLAEDILLSFPAVVASLLLRLKFLAGTT